MTVQQGVLFTRIIQGSINICNTVYGFIYLNHAKNSGDRGQKTIGGGGGRGREGEEERFLRKTRKRRGKRKKEKED